MKVKQPKVTAIAKNLEAAIREERQRLSRELHDRALQLISTARLRIDHCSRQLIYSPEAMKAELSVVADNLDRAVAEMRNLLAENQVDESVQSGTLERRLKEELAIFSARRGVKIDFRCAIDTDGLPIAIERELYFALREGVLNVVRHARASELQLSLTRTPTTYVAKLADNGVGFDVAAANDGGHHYGVTGMRERIKKLGGELVIDSAPGRGTRIEMTIPIAAA
jgi:NarL family two-component system sensor histidine kinase LiaS